MIAPVILAVFVFMSAVMAAGWAQVKKSGNGGWTDVYWTFGTGLAGTAVSLVPIAGAGWPTARQGLVAALVAFWALRLGVYIARRVASSPEDARYTRLRELWGERFIGRMFGFLQIQAPATALLCLAIMVAARRPFPAGLRIEDFAGLAILVVAIAGESLADRQMKAFKADAANHGKVADKGLWGWSRHPNYFFEWVHWLAYPVIAIDLSGAYPEGWLALAGPLFMYLLLTRITGTPPLEAAMIRSKGAAYGDYQARVSAFFPLPPRRKVPAE
jgi:steroid 5-alpha reductase family enzyme